MISILCPSRGRPEQLAEMWSTAQRFATGAVELVVRLDDDDPAIYQLPTGVRFVVDARTVLSRCWNQCAAAASGEILMHAGDDIRFRTPGWDDLVKEAFEQVPDRIAFVYGRDGYQDEKLGTHGFLHRRWVETVGYFVPPYFSSDFNDVWNDEVARMIDRRFFLPDLFIEHMHPCAGKGEWDLTHRERLERHKRDRPQDLYRKLRPERRAAAAKLKEAISAHVTAA